MGYLRKPEWLKIRLGSDENSRSLQGREGEIPPSSTSISVNSIMKKHGLNTVCSEAGCPNKGECFSRGTAAFMILGSSCTRKCRFCKVAKGAPERVNPSEPGAVAEAVKEMKLTHAVITSVTRDDLSDGGAGHFAETISEIRKLCPEVTVEVLIPDFKGSFEALKKVIDAGPDIINHNVETVPGLYSAVRPMAVFERSLELLKRVKETDRNTFTKSGFMVGLGEKEEEVLELLKELRAVDCDVLTIGQYLQPSREHYDVVEYVHPDQFKKYKEIALEMGFKYAASGPLVRSSYHAEDEFAALTSEGRLKKNKD